MNPKFLKTPLVLLTVMILGVAGIAYLNFYLHPSTEKNFEEALQWYREGNSEKAAHILEAELGQYIPLQDGCELMISAFAEQNRNDLLENAAFRCLSAGKAAGIAHEGYAKSLTDQGRVKEAIELLARDAKNVANDRLYGALAYLYTLDDNPTSAGTYYLKAVDIGVPWSPWVSRAIRHDSLSSSRTFVTELVQLVMNKESPVPEVEKSLLIVAEELGLKEEADALRNRQIGFSKKATDAEGEALPLD